MASPPRSMLFITQLCNYSNSLVTTPTYFEGLVYSNKQVAIFASVGPQQFLLGTFEKVVKMQNFSSLIGLFLSLVKCFY